jgi:hypothetical protein
MPNSRAPTDDDLLVAARLRVAEDEVIAKILNDALESRPKSTKKCLRKKQEEFVKWAEEKGYRPPETVTENKVVMFLTERVIGRVSKNDSTKIVGKPTVDQYVTALTSLWKIQREMRINSHPTPRGVSVQHIQKKWL